MRISELVYDFSFPHMERGLLRIKGIVWLSDIVENLESKHEVSSNEVREVLNNRPLFRYVEKGHRKGARYLCSIGAGKQRKIFDGVLCLQEGSSSLGPGYDSR
jgi:hypothetical protein